MSTLRDPDMVVAAWLDDGPRRLPDQTRRAVANAIPSITQRRRGFGPPWRVPSVNGQLRLALAAAAVMVAAVGGLYLFRPGPPGGLVGGPGPTASPSEMTIETPGPSGGTITLTDTGCEWAGKPSVVGTGTTDIAFRNETDDYATFDLHGLVGGHTWDEATAYVEDLNRRLGTGEEWPPNDISEQLPRLLEVGAGSDGQRSITMPVLDPDIRIYGIVCAANTGPTGDILAVYAVGPLEYR
jgi:hypothetical protein